MRRRKSTRLGRPVSPSCVAWCCSSRRTCVASVTSRAIAEKWLTAPASSRTIWTTTPRVRMTPSGPRTPSSPSQRWPPVPVATSRGIWSRTARTKARAAASSPGPASPASRTPTSARAPSLAKRGVPARSKTTTASEVESSSPTRRSASVRRATASVTSSAEPTWPVTPPERSRTGSAATWTQRADPSGRATRNSWTKVAPAGRAAAQARSAATRSSGRALTHGAAPAARGAPPRTISRNASLASVSRRSASASKTQIGRWRTRSSMRSVSHARCT